MSGTDVAYGTSLLRVCYTVSDTELGHAATFRCICYAVCGTELAYCATRITIGGMLGTRTNSNPGPLSPSAMPGTYILYDTTHSLRDIRVLAERMLTRTHYRLAMEPCNTERAVLCCYAMSGTELAYAATRCPGSRFRARLPSSLASQAPGHVPYIPTLCSGTEIAYAQPFRTVLCDVRYWDSVCATVMRCPSTLLRIRYAMSGTGLECTATHSICDVRYRARVIRYAMSGTETACGATRVREQGSLVVEAQVSSYEAAMRCPRTLLGQRDVGSARYAPYYALSCYAIARRCPVLTLRIVLSCYAIADVRYSHGLAC
eukprot:3295132-Rhodomonas_salina.6